MEEKMTIKDVQDAWHYPANKPRPPMNAYPLPDGYECNGEIVKIEQKN